LRRVALRFEHVYQCRIARRAGTTNGAADQIEHTVFRGAHCFLG
jgi:hypothetical protein